MSPSDWLTLQSVPSPGPTPSEKAVPMPKLTVLAEKSVWTNSRILVSNMKIVS